MRILDNMKLSTEVKLHEYSR